MEPLALKYLLVSVDVALILRLFSENITDIFDEDIKGQIAALVKKQKERDTDRARWLSQESDGSSAYTPGKRVNEDFEQHVDRRVR